MTTSASILYSGFYDSPLAFTVRFAGRLYLFLRGFDDGADEYEDQYRVSLLPPLTDEEIEASWLRIEDRAAGFLGRVAVKDVVFDASRRREIDTAVLQAMTAPPEPVGAAR